MSGHADAYKDAESRRFMQRWAPETLPELTEDNLRWNIARARAAEAKYEELRKALWTLRQATR